MSLEDRPPHDLQNIQLDDEDNAHKDTIDIELSETHNNILKKPQDLEDQKPTLHSVRIIRDYGESYPRNFGKYCVLRFKDNEPQIAIGPHWPLFLLAYVAICFGSYALIQQSFKHFTILFQIISILSVSAVLSSYLITAVANPGIASARFPILNEYDVSHFKRYCKTCQIIRPPGTQHCEDCDVCIDSLDHHCPWTGKCIGSGNIKSFSGFIISMLFFMIYSIILVFSVA